MKKIAYIIETSKTRARKAKLRSLVRRLRNSAPIFYYWAEGAKGVRIVTDNKEVAEELSRILESRIEEVRYEYRGSE